jgi:hypothetical protein
MRRQAALDSTDYVNPPYPRRRRLSTNRFCHLSCRPKWRHLWILRDSIRSLPVRLASGPSRLCRGFPGRSILDYVLLRSE